jgi:putative endonuclease
MSRALTGALSFHAGLAAEGAVAAHYRRLGLDIVAQRWRGQGGEIDLIARDGAQLVFIEVKKSRDFARAAIRISQRQIARLFDAASEYMSCQPLGLATPVRFDVALVDGRGMIEVVKNALGP